MPQETPHSAGGGFGAWLSRAWSWLGWSLFFLVGALYLGLSARTADYFDTTGGVDEKFVQGEKSASEKVAVMTIEGVLMEGQGYLKNQIDRIRADESVKAVVVRVDSPGGTVTGSDYVLHHLQRLREDRKIPIVVSMGSMAASGGYYVSMAVGDQEKSIYAEPTTTTGSIGVIIPHYDVSGLMTKFDVKDDSIMSHPRKQMLSMTRPLTEDTRPLVQGYVNQAFERFKAKVKEGRPRYRQAPEELDKLATGEIYSADQAKELGLVDEIGFFEDAIARAHELANLSVSTTKVVRYKRPTALFDLSAVGAAKAAGEPWEVKALAELSAPRAWYLCTMLPGIVPSRRAD